MKVFILQILFFIDNNIFEFIKIPPKINKISNERVFKELLFIIKKCKTKDIKIKVLGSCALTIFLKKDFKHINDIDFAVQASSLREVNTLLAKLGYKRKKAKWPNEYEFIKKGVRVDFFCEDDQKHIYYGIPLEIENVLYKGEIYPLVKPKTLYKMYKKIFLKNGRSLRNDLTKLKILKVLQTPD